jgi:hypothetical protein
MMTERKCAQQDPDAVAVALMLAPGVYSRNRMFALFSQKDMQQARLRARLIRGMFRQFSRSLELGLSVTEEPQQPQEGSAGIVVVYSIERLSLRCRIETTRLERACLAYLLSRSSEPALRSLMPVQDGEHATLDGYLAKLGPELSQ